MRRADREVTDRAEMEAIIAQADYCTLAIHAQDAPYAVPLSFGYANGHVYIHGAREGHKIDLLRRNPRVSLVFVGSCETHLGIQPCSGTTFYRSVIAEGTARFVTDPEEQLFGLDVILAQHSAPGPHAYDPKALEATQVIAIDITAMTGKRSAPRAAR
ncbi:MAG: pyridoxamine 5'-phosphate oxidase family protein [Anaerolineales bacterium]